MISQRYTRSSSLAIAGRGAGGLLVGAAITQRPELFGAALIDAGILDMTRFSRFTIGADVDAGIWIARSSERSARAARLFAAAERQARRPLSADAVTVGDHDDVVTPAHSYKFAAALQAVGGELGAGVASRRLRRGLRTGHPDRPSSSRTTPTDSRSSSMRCTSRADTVVRALSLLRDGHLSRMSMLATYVTVVAGVRVGLFTRASSWP